MTLQLCVQLARQVCIFKNELHNPVTSPKLPALGSQCVVLAGEEIVAALAEGSATFQGKTQFSQAKYKKKKQKKYTVNATIQRPTARSICEVC